MAFVRVKRRHNEDPFNSIVVSHKKLKTVGTDFSRDCVFQFAGTLKDEVSLFCLIVLLVIGSINFTVNFLSLILFNSPLGRYENNINFSLYNVL